MGGPRTAPGCCGGRGRTKVDEELARGLELEEEEEARAMGALMAVEWPERLSLALPEAWRLELCHIGEGRRAQLTPPRKAST